MAEKNSTGRRRENSWFGKKIGNRNFVFKDFEANFVEIFDDLRAGSSPDFDALESDRIPDLHELLIKYGEHRVIEEFADDQYIRKFYALIPEINKSLNLILEKVTNFGLITGLSYGSNDPCAFFKRLRGLDLPEHVAGVLDQISDTADSLCSLRGSIITFLSERIRNAMPNTSDLVGEEVALELLFSAGSLRNLALMPASAIQVLGAEKALFKHVVQGTPPPKHGVIFKCKGMSALKTGERGKAARSIACKAAITLRADYAGTRIDTTEMKDKIQGLLKRKKN